MTFVVKDWQNRNVGKNTPLDETALKDLETRLSDYTDSSVGTESEETNERLTELETERPTVTVPQPLAATDTANIQALIDAGGDVHLRAGTYRSTGLVAKPNVALIGSTRGATILKLASGANTDVIRGVNFATLTGKTKATGDYALGAKGFELRHLTIDGDKSNNSSGYGLRMWGAAPFFDHLMIRNCKSGGLWTEFTEVDSFSDPVQVLEGQAPTLQINNCDGHGWTHRGPHDFTVGLCEIWSCTGWALRVESDQVDGTTYNGGISFKHLNFYLCGNGAYNNGASFEMHGGALSGTTGTGLECTSRSGGMKIRGVIVAGVATGILLRGTGHQIHGEISRCTANGLVLDGAIGCDIHAYGNGNNNVVNVISEGGPNWIRGLFDIPSGKTLKTGASFNAGSENRLRGYGAGGDLYVQQQRALTLVIQTSASAPVGSIFIDAADNTMKKKDLSGTVTAL